MVCLRCRGVKVFDEFGYFLFDEGVEDYEVDNEDKEGRSKECVFARHEFNLY